MSRKNHHKLNSSQLPAAGHGLAMNQVKDTPVGEGADTRSVTTYTEEDLQRLRDEGWQLAKSPTTASAPPRPELPSTTEPHVQETRKLQIVRNFAPGQHGLLNRLATLRDEVYDIMMAHGGRPKRVRPEVALGAVLVGPETFGYANHSAGVQALEPDDVIAHIREGQPPSSRRIITATAGEVAVFSSVGRLGTAALLRLKGDVIATEVRAATHRLQVLADRDPGSEVEIRPVSAAIMLGTGAARIPESAQDEIRAAGVAAFPPETEWQLLPSPQLVPPRPNAPNQPA